MSILERRKRQKIPEEVSCTHFAYLLYIQRFDVFTNRWSITLNAEIENQKSIRVNS